MNLDWPTLLVIGTTIVCVRAMFRPALFSLLILPLLMWQGAVVSAGVSLNAAKVLYGFLFLTLMLQRFCQAKWRERRGEGVPREQAKKIWPVLYIAFFSTVVFILLPSPASEVTYLAVSMWQTPPWRGIVAAALWCARILPVFVAARWVRSPQMFARCIRVFLVAMIITAGIGLLQWIGFYLFPPLERALAYFSFEGVEGDGGGVYVGSKGLVSYRPSALAGEPRHFAFAMSISAMLTLLCSVSNVPYIPKWMKHPALFILFTVMVIFSGSASAILSTFVGLIALLGWFMIRGAREASQTRSILKLLAMVLVPALLVGLLGSRFGYFERVMDYIEQVVFIDSSRGAAWLQFYIEGSRGQYTAYLSWLAAEPQYLVLGAGIGNGAFHAYDYLPSSNPFSRLTFTTARVGIIDLISDIGLVGAGLVGMVWLSWWRYCARRIEFLGLERATVVHVSLGMIVFLVAYSLAFDASSVIWFFFGVAFGCCGNLPLRAPDRALTGRLSVRVVADSG